MSAAWNRHRARVALKERRTGIGTNRPVELQPWRVDQDNELLQRVLLEEMRPLTWRDALEGVAWFFSAYVATLLVLSLVRQ